MTARAYDIMRELPAIFATVSGIVSADVEIGFRNPATIAEDELPRVIIYDPTTADPEPSEFGLRADEFGFFMFIVNDLDTDEATLQMVEEMATALSAATLTNADTAFMNPGSIVTDGKTKRSIAVASIVANYEGL